MTNYTLQKNETILYQGNVSLEHCNGTTEILLTNLNLVFIITTKKLLSKSNVEVETYLIDDIKLYNNVPQIKQKSSRVEIFMTCAEIVVNFVSIFEASKFVNAALRLLTGKTMAERSADKFKGAIGLVDDTLGINTVGTIKNVLENGIAGSLLGGFGKKSAPAQEALPTNTPSAPTDEQLETLKKLKELVDMGVLTQEEFEAKKRQLLDL